MAVQPTQAPSAALCQAWIWGYWLQCCRIRVRGNVKLLWPQMTWEWPPAWKTKRVVESVSCSVISLCDPMDYSLPGSSVHGILQARILEWVAISFSRRGSSWLRDRTWVSCIAGRFFTIWTPGEIPESRWKSSKEGGFSDQSQHILTSSLVSDYTLGYHPGQWLGHPSI